MDVRYPKMCFIFYFDYSSNTMPIYQGQTEQNQRNLGVYMWFNATYFTTCCWELCLRGAQTVHAWINAHKSNISLPKSLSQESGASPRCLQAGAPQVPLVPIWQALAMDVTRYSSSVFLQPHQLISGWLHRAITTPFLWCLTFKVKGVSKHTFRSGYELV